MSHIYLKMKIKSLAAEAQIIRREERRFKRGDHPIRVGLSAHRRIDVRQEARAAGLAYGFLRGRDYRRLEAKTHTKPDWARVEKLALKYGVDDQRDLKQRFAEWKAA